jgi:O-acetyl-ADP-ribose deacetylase (regulator of RNase III)
MTSRRYRVGPSTITVRFGDITASGSEVLVSSDDFELSMGGGVSQAILAAAGPRILDDARKRAPARVGDVVVTSAGRLPARYLFHAITIGPESDELSRETIVRQTCQKAMRLLPLLGCRSIAFPAIGTGLAGIPSEEAASEMAAVLVGALLDAAEPYEVELYLHDSYGGASEGAFFVFFEHFAARTLALETTRERTGRTLEPPTPDPSSTDPEEARDLECRSQVFTMLRHLDARRNMLETSLIDALADGDSDTERTLARVRAQLAEIQALRHGYEAEVAPAVPEAPPIPNSVFLSSTYVDLKPHRDALRGVIDQLQLAFVGMEEFSPAGEMPGTYIRRKVTQAEVFVGVIGRRYGYIDPTSGLSMTELEYRQAVVSKKPLYIFVMRDTALISADMVERDPEALSKLNEFTARVLRSNVCGMFADIPDLVDQATRALEALR